MKIIFRTRDAICCRHFWQYPLLLICLSSSSTLVSACLVKGQPTFSRRLKFQAVLLVWSEPEAKQTEGRKNKQLVIPFD